MKKPRLKVNVYTIVQEAVYQGVLMGWNRAHKHTDKPGAEHTQWAIEQAVMNALSEVIDWD